MKKVLFFTFLNKLELDINPGVGVLSTALKNNGDKVFLFPYVFFNEALLKEKIENIKPDLIALSATSRSKEQVERIAMFMQQNYNIPVLLGGVFSILESESALKIQGVDAICIGDGTKGITEYLYGKYPATNMIYKNGIKGKIEPQGKLLPIDYDLFYNTAKEYNLAMSNKLDYFTTYTCEFACKFCSANLIKRLKGIKGKPRENPETVINQINNLVKKYGFKKVHFRDPLFLGIKDFNWIEEFLLLYKKRINLPYTCNIRADFFNEQIAKLLSDTGCIKIKVGLETGDEKLRAEILGKKCTNEQFIDLLNLSSKYSIKVSLNAMIGIPNETEESALETVNFLNFLQPTKSLLHIFQPWEGLELDDKIKSQIKFIKNPAINDESTMGRLSNNNDLSLEIINRINDEYIISPVLDSPEFTYKMALSYQDIFLYSKEVKRDE